MKKIYSLLLFCCISVCSFNVHAQVTGTKTIGVEYATLAAAITDLNTIGISGNVIINVPAGYTETALAGGYKLGSATLNASTSATATLTIRKNGAGANPLLTAPTGTSTTLDGIFFIQGTDYVTIDGISLTEAAANATATTQMEWGYALVKRQASAPFDGCQNVTIKNCAITLNRTNTASVGIYANNHVATSLTALTITVPADAMNNCVFSADTIRNTNTAISLRGYSSAASPYSLYDQNNTVGGSSTTGNVIQNFAGASSGAGVNLQYQNNATVSYNNIDNMAGGGITGGSTLYGVYLQNGTNISANITNNTINVNQGSSSITYGVYAGVTSTGTISVNSNQLTAGGGTSGAIYMIHFTGAMTNTNTLNNIFYNINVATTGSFYLIYHTGSATPFYNTCTGNYTSGPGTPYVTKTGAGGTVAGYYDGASTTSGATIISGNNFSSFSLAGSPTFYGVYESNGLSGTTATKAVRNNIISNITSVGGTLNGMSIAYSVSQNLSNCQINNLNAGTGTVYGIVIGTTTTTDTISNCHISNLTSTGANVYGIYMNLAFTTARIYGDTINSLSTSATGGLAYGIFQNLGTTIEIYKNTLYDIAGTGTNSSVNGMYLNSGTATVSNNLVGDLRTPNYTGAANSGTQLVGIYCGGGTAHTLSHNTVYLNGTSTGAIFGSSAVHAATSNVTFRNNIFINLSTPSGTGMVTAYRRSSTTLTGYQAASNNNLFYAGTPAANKTIMYDGTTAYQTLAAYQTLVTPRDAASVTENVTFQAVTGGGANFLKPSLTIATQIESGGIVIAGLTDDIYGTIRGGNTGYAGTGVAPDLGAVEANYLPLDFAAPAVSYTALGGTCATGDRTLTATITDLSGVPTTGSLRPRIYYKKGSGSWFSNAGVLTTGTGNSGTWTFTILAADVSGIAVGDVISYFIVAQDVATTPNIGSSPAGAVATDVNTITTYPSAPNTYSVNPTLSGIYTVGVGGAFTTLTQAVNAYNTACLTGPVTFSLIDASYPSETYPMTILANTDASATNTLTIRPATGVAANISGTSSAVALFKLLNAKYITIDGVNTGGASLTLTNNNTTTSGNTCDIWLAAGAAAGSGNSNITLKNMTIIGGAGASTTNQGIVAAIDGVSPANTNGMDNDNVTITGNTFKRMGYTVRAVGTATTSAGALDNWTISNNIMGPSVYSATDNIGYNGVFLRNMVKVTVSGNTMQNIGYTTGATWSMAGVYAEAGIDTIVISGNTFANMMSTGTGTGTGANMVIYLGTNVIDATVTNNNIHSIFNNNTGGYGVRAIIVNNGVAAGNVVIANNMVSDIYGYCNTSNANWPIGIDIDGASGGVKVYYNTVNLSGAHTGLNSATGSACLFVNATGGGIDVKDNVFSNSYDNSSSTTDKGWAIYSNVANTNFSTIDYNDYYAATPNVPAFIGTDRLILADIVTGFGGNANSIIAQPTFVSSTDAHLQAINANAPLISGAPIAGFTTDIDGATRHAVLPVMGADEVSIPGAPPAISYALLGYTCVSADRTVTATISNASSGVPATGSLVPRIYYRKNSGTWFSQPGTLTTGTGTLGTWTFTIVVSDMGGTVNNDVVSYYIIAQTNGGVVGASPSAGLVAADVNTVTTHPTTPNAYTMLLLNGTYTVGAGGDYPTITAAVAAYNAACMSGPATFLLTDATYPSETFPITINRNVSASATNVLTIKPATGISPTITGSSASAVIILNGTQYVTIEGSNSPVANSICPLVTASRNLTITNTNTSATSAVVWMQTSSTSNSATNNIIRNCNITGSSNAQTLFGIGSGGTTIGYTSLGNGNSNNRIENDSISFVQTGIFSMGASSAAKNQNNVIDQNVMTSSAATGYVRNNGIMVGFENNIEIAGNNIANATTSTSNDFVGINVGFGNNDMSNTTTAGSDVTNAVIRNNNLDNLTKSTAFGIVGIAVVSPSAGTTTISNNMLNRIGGAATPADITAGIYVGGNGAGAVNIYYNTVVLSGSFGGTAVGAALLVNGTDPILNVRNNIFKNAIVSTNALLFAVATSSSTYANLTSDYNAYYTTSANFARTGGIVAATGTNQANLAAWQSATGKDANSVVLDPTFVSATDLHLQTVGANMPLAGGTVIAGITTDMFCTTRGATATVMGAHEMNINVVPPTITYTALAGTCATGDRVLTATIANPVTGVPTSGTLVPRIYYKKGSGSWFSQPGTLASGGSSSGTWNFTIVASDMGGVALGDVVSYYVIAQTVGGSVGSQPSAGLVAANVNTVTTPPTTPNTYSVNPTLAGTYNVGVGGDYPTITAAVNVYNNACLTGAVNFVLTDATYPSETYPITINRNNDASATNVLTIKPAAGVSPTISGSSATAVVVLNGAQYVTIEGSGSPVANSICPAATSSRNLTITNTNTSATSAVVWMQTSSTSNSASNNTIRNCNITGSSNTQTLFGIGSGGTTIGYTSLGTNNNNNIIENDSVSSVQTGIFSMGSSATAKNQGNVIRKNVLTNATSTGYVRNNGIMVGFENNIQITGNVIANMAPTVSNDVMAINVGFPNSSLIYSTTTGNEVTNATISFNKIDNCFLTSSFSIAGIGLLGPTTGTTTVANNMISRLGGKPTPSDILAGIFIGGNAGGTINVYYNTINITGTTTGGTTASNAIAIAGSNPIVNIKNNIFDVNISNGSSTLQAIALDYSTYTNLVSDYNSFYTVGANMGIVGGITSGTNQATLAAWQTTTGQDAHSITLDPVFVSTSDLHLQSVATNMPLAAGTVIAGITTDLFCTTRGATTPVIGAHEMNINSVPPTITYTALAGTCATSDRTLTATIANAVTGVPTSGALVPRIYYKKGSGSWFSQPGTLASGGSASGTWNFTIVVSDVGGVAVGDVVSYYVIAQTVGGAVGSQPAAGLVAANVNTVTTPPTTPNTYSVYPTLAGTYNVGVGGDYATITAAVNAYNTACLTGAVTFALTDATYPSETYPITVNTNAAASATNTLTIRPAAGVAVNINGSTSAVAIFKFLNAKYVTLDGVNTGGASMTLNNNNTGTSCDVWLAAGAAAGSGNNNITIKNANLVGGAGNSTTNQGILAGIDGATPANTNGMDNDNITITGNTFKKMGYTIRALGTAATSPGGLDNWVISNNIMGPSAYSATDNIGYNGMFLQNMLNVTISGNTLQNIGYNTAWANQVVGIYMPQNITGLVISGNNINNIVSTGTGTGTGANNALYLGTTVTGATITNNKINTIYNTATGGYGARGIVLNTATALSNITIANNMISDIYGYSNTANGNWPIGISIEGTTGGVNMYYNSVYLSGDHTGVNAATGSACLFVNTTGTTLDIRNNLLVNNYNNSSSTADKGWAIYSLSASSVFAPINYNDYAAAAPNVLGYLTSDRVTLADIVTGFGGNANSISAQPQFVSATDLHLLAHASNLPLIAGTPLAAVTTDIDGTTRNTPPVIGADEIVIPNCSGTPTAGTVTATAFAGCGPFSSNLNLTGSTFLPGITYQWETSTDNVTYTPITGATTQAYSVSVSSTVYYRATLTCTIGGLSASTAGAQLVVNPVPAITGTPSVCNGSSTTMAATVSGGTWISSNGTIATVGSSTGIVNGLNIGTVTLTYTITSTGCNATSVFTVNAAPMALAVSPAASAVCANGPANLLTALHDSVQINGSFGTRQNQNANTGYPAPFSVYWGGQRTQFLVLASELTAMGYSAGFSLTGLEFPISSLGASYTDNNNFMVRIAPTSLTSISAFVTTGLDTVRNPANYIATVGNSVVPFDDYYTWDGTSNLVFDLTFSNNITGSTARTAIHYNTNTSFQSTIVYRSDNVTALAAASSTTVSTSHSARADFVIRARKQLPVTWTLPAGLYTDAAATTAYTGSATPTVYALPAATTTFTATSVYNGCTSSATATVTVNPQPAVIGGSNTVCLGSTTTLTNDTTGGTWSSSASSIASVNTTTGVVTGAGAGTATITYTRAVTGCFRTMQMTVNPLPSAITGTASVCETATTTLANVGGGTWSSDGTSIAIVDPTTGVVTGVAAGFAQITYTLPTSCKITQQVTVNPKPVVSVSPAPVPDICFGGTTNLAAGSTMNEFALISQDFNAGLGAWTITNVDGIPASQWHLTTPPGYGGEGGDGTQMIEAAPDAYPGVTDTRFTSPSFSTVGYGAVTVSFNEYLLSLATSDATVAVQYSTDGGTLWNTFIDQVNDVAGTGAWSISSPEISVALPAGALGQPNVKLRWNYYSVQGLWWAVDNIKVTAAQPAPSYVWSGVSGATGLSCTACASVDVTPASTGANVYSVLATTTQGCTGSATATVSVNPLPSAIGGTLVVCEGLTTTATDVDAGGTWAIGATSIATVDASTGIITGVADGTAEITYTLPTGCTVTAIVTVNPLPAAIDGVTPVCLGLTVTLSDVDAGGTWGSSNTAIADIDASGVVTGIADGMATITYTLPTGCIMTAVMTVNPLPAAIGGTPVVCEGLTTTLTDADAGGTWSSSASTIAGIGSASGIVTGNSAGNAVITYTLPTGCITTTNVTVNHTPVAIGGSLAVCHGQTTSLTNTDAGGTWSSSATTIADINTSGLVSGVSPGTATITYALPTGCITTSVVTVNVQPVSIIGSMIICQGVTGTLTDATAGGTWSSGATTIATIGSTTGAVTGVSAGIAPITYAMPTGCYVTANVTVNASPATITGTPQVCIGSTTALSNADPGGTWSSSATGIASISATGVVSGVSMGTATITYALSAGCISTKVVTVDPLPAPISGPSQLCVDATGTFTDGTAGGTWTSNTTAVATIDNTTGIATAIASGTTIITYTSAAGCIRTRVLTVNPLPLAIAGPSELCKNSTITLSDPTVGGTWSSGTPTVATISGSGVLSAVNDGVASITYTLSTGCTTATSVTVNPLPSAITGTTAMCQGQTTTLFNGVPGGTWSSATPANALVDATTGVVTGIGAGTAFISYTLPTGCSRAVAVVVNAMPSAITGATSVCQGTTTTMTTTSTGGVWTSSTTTVASIGLTTGVVTGLAAGTTNISYTMPGGCSVTYTITVEAMPTAFTGVLAVCSGQTTTLSSTSPGGTWSSSNAAVATVGTSGVVSGIAAGTSVISYAVPSGCVRTAVVTVNALPAVYNVTGGGSYCAGGSGVHIGLDNSAGGVNYQLYSGAGAIGGAVAGVPGMPIDFGFVTPVGTYSVVAATTATGCSSVMAGTATITVSAPVPASVSFTTGTGSDTVCSGIPVTFAATAINGGTAPVYQWQVNGLAVPGATSNTYSYLPTTGDVVTVNMSSSITCATPSVATASRTLTVNTSVMPVSGITVTPGASVCEGSSVTFTASALYGGSAPVYIWMKNATVVAVGPTYSYVPANGDVVVVKLVSNYACALEDTVLSSTVTMTVSPVFTPSVTITATPGTVVQVGTLVTLTAGVSGAGPSPEYQWYIGSSAVLGATSSVFSYSSFAEGDSVTCQVKGTGACGQLGFNSVIMHVGGVGVEPGTAISDVRLMPNPNKGEFVVKGTLSVTTDKEVEMEVVDMLGQVVYRTKVMARNGNVEARIKLDNTLANGMYMLNMISGEDRKVFHFVLGQ